ncbi:carboxymuconolactone decarboxylase family protein [Streptomyces sp. NBC_00237]|uniref:carboxymuconolactone decarboxylase family protein n=1 Tax=Streptomyces sp. NBC_00237 TaxID=2975687 RepID=UPI00224E08DF|nr:carboxymuconolactone decarboxylase family protein [Streptomyces sp. NBC_00237]MCX5204420.1 carboxymuconolactone decarboxylase family protein [Streptomyces sp. NBC_00237]
MEARMANPATIIPEAYPAILSVMKAARKGGVPESTMELIHLRISQINGCGVCVVGGAASARKSGETEERLDSVAVWRDAPYFTDAERAALDLAESATRLADRPDPVSDEVWNEAAKHYDEKQLAGITLWIGVSNLFNRLNATTRQVAGATW